MESEAPRESNLVWVLRLLLVLHLGLVVFQAATAGSFLEGSRRALDVHQLAGTTVLTAISVLQVVVASVCWRRGRATAAMAVGSGAVFLTEMVQIGLGFQGELALHVPLGALIVGLALLLAAAGFRRLTPVGDAGGARPEAGDGSSPTSETES